MGVGTPGQVLGPDGVPGQVELFVGYKSTVSYLLGEDIESYNANGRKAPGFTLAKTCRKSHIASPGPVDCQMK